MKPQETGDEGTSPASEASTGDTNHPPESPASEASTGDVDHPILRVVNPDATPEEVAALVAVFSALGSAGGDDAPRPTPEWSAPQRLHRQPVRPDPGGWRSSGLPR